MYPVNIKMWLTYIILWFTRRDRTQHNQKAYLVSASVLATRTREALAARPRVLTYEVIAEECGVSARWVQQFAADTIADPGVAKVEALYTFLTGKELDI